MNVFPEVIVFYSNGGSIRPIKKVEERVSSMGFMGRPRPVLVAVLLFVCAALGHAQGIDLNTYYAYPFSVAVSFDNVTPYIGDKLDYSNYYGVGLTARLPLPDAPIFQPFLRLGVNWFNFATDSTDLKFQNSQYYLMPGIGWSTRLAKNLEMGVDVPTDMR